MSLHRILSLFVLVIAAIALCAAVSLVMLTTYLHRTTVELETALQSVRIAEEMQIDLHTYIGTEDPLVRKRVESALRSKLHQARQYVNAPEEESLLAQTEQLVEAYFIKVQHNSDLPNTAHDLDPAFTALRRFIDINVEQADQSMRESEGWDDFGNHIGLGVSAVLVLGITGMLIWLRRVAFRPVFEIQRAIRDFAAGRKDTRAPEHGPEELKVIARQFNDMAVSLARQYESQLSFLAAVAHDLRNPLGALKASASILTMDRHLPPETVSNVMSVIKRQVHDLDRMIGDLLDISRIEAGHLELRIVECDIRAVAQDAFDLFKLAPKEHQLMLKLPDAPLIGRCDPLRIRQVFNNLISNAVKYSPSGTRIELILEQAGDEALFGVSDQGVGIPEDELRNIFEPFRRTKVARDVPGVGLGLSVAQRIVRAHGGQIQVESQLGKGSTFRVRLPAPREASSQLTA